MDKIMRTGKLKSVNKLKTGFAVAAMAFVGFALASGTIYSGAGSVVVPEPMKVIDFNKGLHELAMGEEYYEIIPSDKLYVQKKPEEVDTGELVDANGIVYFGKEEGIYYYKREVSNQPHALYSRERGTFLQMGKKRVIPPVYKSKSAGLDNALETELLDKAVPYESTDGAVSGQGVLIQDEYVANSEMAVANPFAGEEIAQSIKENGGLAFSYWIKAPAYDAVTYEASSVLRWEVKDGMDYDAEPAGELQIDLDNSIFWTIDGNTDKSPDYALSMERAVSPVTAVKDDGTVVVGGNCGSWHHVVVNMTNHSVEFYVDGNCVNIQETYGIYSGWEGALCDWITSENATLHFGGAGDFAGMYGLASGSCEFSIDDLMFYGQNLTNEQVRAAYENEVAKRNFTINPAGTAMNMGCVTDASVGVKNAVHTCVETISGRAVAAIQVDGNKKVMTSTGAQIANPFAGRELEGVTIGYWVKQEDADNTSVIAFVDEENEIFHPKGSVEVGKSILYVENTGLSIFAEGYFNPSVCNSVQNLFYAAPDKAGQEAVLEKSTEWMYITLSMDNLGVRYYVNGEPAAKVMYVEPTSRFLDGYYMTVKDATEVRTCYGVFGKTGNQGATTMMEFLTREDTKLYLGYYPTKGGQINNKTSGCMFAGFKSADVALTDEEVKEFYENRYEGLTISEVPSQSPTGPAVSEEPENFEGVSEEPENSEGVSEEPESSESVPVIKGDVDGDNKVTLADAQMTLKAALKIQSLNEGQQKAADVDENAIINLLDAQIILKMALKIM